MDGILKNSQSGRERSRVQNWPRGEDRASWGRGSVGVRVGIPLRKRWQGRRLQMHPHPCVRGRRQEVREVPGWGEICLALRLRRGQPGILGRAGQGGWKRAVIGYLLPHCSEPHPCLFACSKPPGGRGTWWGEAPGGGGRGQRRAGSLSQASSRCKMS